jgi:hypothetical protein
MLFLFRAAFYIGVVLLVMPPPKEGPQPGAKLASTEGATDSAKRTSAQRTSADARAKAANRKAVPAKGAAVPATTSKVASVPSSDIAEYGARAAAYCLRKPDVCRTGNADGIGERLSRGAGIISALIADVATTPAMTGSLSRGTP